MQVMQLLNAKQFVDTLKNLLSKNDDVIISLCGADKINGHLMHRACPWDYPPLGDLSSITKILATQAHVVYTNILPEKKYCAVDYALDAENVCWCSILNEVSTQPETLEHVAPHI